MTPTNTKNAQIWGPKMGPRMSQNGEGGAQANLDAGFKKALGPKMLPRWPEMASSSPR